MEPSLTDNARSVLEARYLRRDPTGALSETPGGMMRRIAHAVAAAEAKLGTPAAASKWEERFFELLVSLDFLPNSPTLMNAGTPVGQLSACFVLPIEDDLGAIFDALKWMALIQQSGGGTGFSFSRLRPKGDSVATTGGVASGPLSFLRIFDTATDNIKQGGRRRGANMGVLRVDHPDIESFVEAKLEGGFENFNLSVAATDAFVQSVRRGEAQALRSPRTGQVVGRVDARGLFERIATAAWRCGDPGLYFVDAANRANPTPDLGSFEATNPCGEVPLLPFEACNLGSINLSHMLRGGAVDWDKLDGTARVAVRFLDDVIDVSRWTTDRIEGAVRGNRKIGLGVMGFAEMLVGLGIPYGSDAAAKIGEQIMQRLSESARAASGELAAERGVFPNWPKSVHAERGVRLRNATCTSIAPTGTISIIAGTSASIEPLFAVAYRRRHVLGGLTLVELNPVFLKYADERGLATEALKHALETKGSLSELDQIPPHVRELFRTALELDGEDHLRIQAAFQRHNDNAVSKTINLPERTEPERVRAIYMRAWELGLKGVTIFRYGSKSAQVLELGTGERAEDREHFARCDPEACRV